MSSLFRRRDVASSDADSATDLSETSESVDVEDTEAPPVAGVRPKAYTPGKGRPTPKRRDAQKRAAPLPTDRKEATRALRERQRAERAEARRRMMDGDEKYLPPRDRGPERALARDVVDSRRNVGGYFLIAALVILIGTSSGMPLIVRYGAQFLWYALALAFIIDCVVLSRRVKRLVRAKYPKSTVRFAGLYMYGVMRSITFRRMRMPKPKVKLGEIPTA